MAGNQEKNSHKEKKWGARKTRSIVAIRPKPPFKPIFHVAANKQNSEIRIINGSLKGNSVFLLETEESPSIPETTIFGFVEEQ
jgi:site-specific DNA recombinase